MLRTDRHTDVDERFTPAAGVGVSNNVYSFYNEKHYNEYTSISLKEILIYVRLAMSSILL